MGLLRLWLTLPDGLHRLLAMPSRTARVCMQASAVRAQVQLPRHSCCFTQPHPPPPPSPQVVAVMPGDSPFVLYQRAQRAIK